MSVMAGILAMSAGGAMMLYGSGTDTPWRLGLNLVVVATLALLVSGIGAWLANSETAVPTTDVPRVRLVFVVQRDQPDLFAQLTAMLATQDGVQVVLDRRDRARDEFDREVMRRGWSVTRVRA